MYSLYLDLPSESDLDHDQARQRGATGHAVAATASPLASLAAIKVLQRGGSAADAVVAAQAVLGLVEPHASGFGGGTVIVWHDQQTGDSGVIDGLAAAPAEVTDRLQIDFDGRTIPRERAMFGGRTVGVPGTLRALEKIHQRFGCLSWHPLFDAAREHASAGFAMPPYLIKTLTEIGSIQDEPLAQRIYCGGTRRAVAEGTLIQNPDYAKTLALIAEQGVEAFYQGAIAKNLIDVVTQDAFASHMTLADLKNYAAIERSPARYRYNGAQVMTAPAPVFGGISAGQIVGMIEALGLTGSDLTDNPDLLHAVLEAGRLAFADRGAYIGEASDPSVNSALLNPAYLAERAKTIDLKRRASSIRYGDLGAPHTAGPDGTGLTSAMTSHLVVSDLKGLTISMTTTINQNFGSRLSIGGFYLNNVQTNFAAQPTTPHSKHRAYNAMASGRRAMTSFAPSIMLDSQGQIKAALGAGGGNRIVGFVANALLRIAAGYKDAQKIVSAPQAMNWNGLSNIEPGFAHARADLTERQHYFAMRRMDGGTQVALKQGAVWNAGGDIRRDGTAIALLRPKC
jgi:gamma-glutamyltranspeptidase/glutathione hydrolase